MGVNAGQTAAHQGISGDTRRVWRLAHDAVLVNAISFRFSIQKAKLLLLF
jgi:hypothetical protein